jgi:hypothetical protein
MTNEEFEFVEIYPNIVVYKNVFENPTKMYDIVKNSSEVEGDKVFGEWSEWSIFGKYINYPAGEYFNRDWSYTNLQTIETYNQVQNDQKYFLLELAKGFDKVTDHYISKFGKDFDFDKTENIQTKDGELVPLWRMYGPSICKYHKNMEDIMSMTYHSDFIREPIPSPGYKFAITANAYFNEDYVGGEIDFFVNGELIKYKPEAGDWLVFPSGHPEVLRKGDTVYLHGVFPSYENEKYFARMYWRKYSIGSQEWFDKENEFGKEVWASMQNDIIQEYNKTIPNRFEIPEGVRVR